MALRTQQYRPGTRAPITGIYLAFHGEEPLPEGETSTFQHRDPHSVIVVRGEKMPNCRVCKESVRFELVDSVSHIGDDVDFAGLKSAV